jgi:hypothetical protein
MRESHRRDGSVVVFGDADDQDELVAEARIQAFVPVPGNARCACGTPLQRWSLRHAGNGAEIGCSRCHRVHGFLELEVQVHR